MHSAHKRFLLQLLTLLGFLPSCGPLLCTSWLLYLVWTHENRVNLTAHTVSNSTDFQGIWIYSCQN